jgi:hypothetical protein
MVTLEDYTRPAQGQVLTSLCSLKDRSVLLNRAWPKRLATNV